MAASVEDIARSSMENLIKELHKEREVSNKERLLRQRLIDQLTEYDTQKQERENEMKDLRKQNQQMSEQIEKLKDTINKYEQNKDSDKASNIDIKEEEDASEVAVAEEATTKADTDDDDSKSGGTAALAIEMSDSTSEPAADIDDDEKIENDSEGRELDKLPMNERRRFLTQVRMILRFTFRGYFGLSFANRWGYWWDRYMSTQVWKYGDWLNYPDGHHVLEGHSGAVLAAAVSIDGHFLFTAVDGGSIMIWNLLDNSMLKNFNVSDKMITCLSYERDWLMCGGKDNKIRIFNGITHDLISTMEGHSDFIRSITLSEKSNQIVSTSADKSIKIWSIETGDCLATFTGHTDMVSAAYFTDNDSKIISGGKDKCIKVWSVKDKNECDTMTEDLNGKIYDMCVNCDSSLVACCLLFGISVYTWPTIEIEGEVVVTAFRGRFHPSKPEILAISVPYSNAVKICNVRSGDTIAEYKGHTHRVSGLCWSRDGFLLVSICDDSTARVWNCSELF